MMLLTTEERHAAWEFTTKLEHLRLVVLVIGHAVVVVVSMFYIVYHTISKLRGNEKNRQLNNFGLMIACFAFTSYSIESVDYGTELLIPKKERKWIISHYLAFRWLWRVADGSYLMMLWFFNYRYVKSAVRFPLLKRSANLQARKLAMILEQRES